MQTWMQRRRHEFQHAPAGIRVVGAVGWVMIALSLMTRMG